MGLSVGWVEMNIASLLLLWLYLCNAFIVAHCWVWVTQCKHLVNKYVSLYVCGMVTFSCSFNKLRTALFYQISLKRKLSNVSFHCTENR